MRLSDIKIAIINSAENERIITVSEEIRSSVNSSPKLHPDFIMKKQSIILISVLLQLTPALVDVNNIEIPEEKLDESESESGGKKNLILLPASPFPSSSFYLNHSQ